MEGCAEASKRPLLEEEVDFFGLSYQNDEMAAYPKEDDDQPQDGIGYTIFRPNPNTRSLECLFQKKMAVTSSFIIFYNHIQTPFACSTTGVKGVYASWLKNSRFVMFCLN